VHGCNGFSIDLSNAAFPDLGDLAVGRTRATWYFNQARMHTQNRLLTFREAVVGLHLNHTDDR
jgi:expansin (peptidoglycan-binding protein)